MYRLPVGEIAAKDAFPLPVCTASVLEVHVVDVW